MILKNPLNEKLSVEIKGIQYEIEPLGTLDIPDEHAFYWKNNLHRFLETPGYIEPVEFVEEVQEVVPVVETVIIPEVEPVVEEIQPEVQTEVQPEAQPETPTVISDEVKAKATKPAKNK